MTSWPQVAAQAAQALLQHRLRAALSGTGLVFGVAAIVAALAIADGARAAATAEYGALGVTNILIRDQSPAGVAPLLRLADLEPLAAVVRSVDRVAASRVARVTAGSGDRHVESVPIAGITEAWPGVAGASLAAGRWPSPTDFADARRVAILGDALARQLFGRVSAIGQRVAAGRSWFDVVGVTAPRASGGSAMSLFDMDMAILIPFGAMDITQGQGDAPDLVRELTLRVVAADDVSRAASVAAVVMARQHGDATRYQIVVPAELLRARLAARRTANVVLFAIGGLALLISGVGIMNIMLANVLERTPEIGIRRAFGARRTDIAAQFTIEAALLCVVGGIAGLPLGTLMAGIAAWAGGWPISISLTSVLLALGLATAVGIGFGLYPARRAALITPVDALRA